MISVSEVKSTPPEIFLSDYQREVYSVLEKLGIDFLRVDNEPAVTMDDCVAIDQALNVKTVKTLLLCNRQKTKFYLFVTEGDKPFVTKDFGRKLEISRVSFAPAEMLGEMLGCEVGSTTVLTLHTDKEKQIQLVIDKAVLNSEYYGCTDSTTTSYMRIKTDDLINKYLPFSNHEAIYID